MKQNTSGRILLSSQYRKRKITVPCYVFSTKLNDIPRLRDEFYNLTVDTEVVWLRELRKRKPKIIGLLNLLKMIFKSMMNTEMRFTIMINSLMITM